MIYIDIQIYMIDHKYTCQHMQLELFQRYSKMIRGSWMARLVSHVSHLEDMKSGQGLETWADGSTFKGEYRRLGEDELLMLVVLWSGDDDDNDGNDGDSDGDGFVKVDVSC